MPKDISILLMQQMLGNHVYRITFNCISYILIFYIKNLQQQRMQFSQTLYKRGTLCDFFRLFYLVDTIGHSKSLAASGHKISLAKSGNYNWP